LVSIFLKELFSPKTIAIIGASRKPSKIGSIILSNITKGNYKGQIFPINPNAKTIQGHKCYPNIGAVKEDIDLAIIALPASTVPFIISETIEKRVKYLIIISSGFKETGKAGEKLENQIKQRLKGSQTRLIGVNCLGIMSMHNNLNASFAGYMVKPGNIAFISQSGAFGTAALDYFEKHQLGLSHFISIGNKTDLDECDFLETLATDSHINCFALYLENISRGKLFLELTKKISLTKPIIILKPGKSEKTQKAISSHTGSLAQNHLVVSAGLSQAGVIEANTIREMFDLLSFLYYNPPPHGDNITILTNAGGPSVQVVDKIAHSKLQLTNLSSKTTDVLKASLPKASSKANPVDILGDAKADRYDKSLETLTKDKGTDIILTICTPQAMTELNETAIKIGKHRAKSSNKTFVASFIGGASLKGAKAYLDKYGVPSYDFPEDAITVLDKMIKYTDRIRHLRSDHPIAIQKHEFSLYEKISNILINFQQEDDIILDPKLCFNVMNSIGLVTPYSAYPKNIQESLFFANKIGYPLVVKLSTAKLLHKTEHKAVYVNIKNDRELTNAFSQLIKTAKKLNLGDIRNEKFVQIQTQIQNGIELILGVKRDISFGHTILFGGGGIFANLYKDISCRVSPMTEEDVYEMIEETKIFEILSGYRGRTSYDITLIINAIKALNRLVSKVPIIKELDINPLIITTEGAFAVDVKIVLTGKKDHTS